MPSASFSPLLSLSPPEHAFHVLPSSADHIASADQLFDLFEPVREVPCQGPASDGSEASVSFFVGYKLKVALVR